MIQKKRDVGLKRWFGYKESQSCIVFTETIKSLPRLKKKTKKNPIKCFKRFKTRNKSVWIQNNLMKSQ